MSAAGFCPRCGLSVPSPVERCARCGYPGAPTGEWARRIRTSTVVALVGGALIVVAPFLPWASLNLASSGAEQSAHAAEATNPHRDGGAHVERRARRGSIPADGSRGGSQPGRPDEQRSAAESSIGPRSRARGDVGSVMPETAP